MPNLEKRIIDVPSSWQMADRALGRTTPMRNQLHPTSYNYIYCRQLQFPASLQCEVCGGAEWSAWPRPWTPPVPTTPNTSRALAVLLLAPPCPPGRIRQPALPLAPTAAPPAPRHSCTSTGCISSRPRLPPTCIPKPGLPCLAAPVVGSTAGTTAASASHLPHIAANCNSRPPTAVVVLSVRFV